MEAPDFDLTKLWDTNILCETGVKPIFNNYGVDEMGYIGDADYYKNCQGAIANSFSTVPTLILHVAMKYKLSLIK